MAKTAKNQAALDRETERVNADAQVKHTPPPPAEPQQSDSRQPHPSPDPVKPRF